MHSRPAMTPSSRVVAQAAAWLVRMEEGLSVEHRQQLDAWRAGSEEHERVWRAAMQLKSLMGSLPSELGQPVLGRARIDRRRLLLSIGLLASAGPAAWLGYREWPVLNADYRTASGEQQSLQLPEGSQLQLNIRSAVDITYSARERLIRLNRGEIYIVTAPDNIAQPRPLSVVTRQGVVRALGTRFSVRSMGDHIEVKVFEHAVAIIPAGVTAQTRIEAGHQLVFDRQRAGKVSVLQQHAPGWTRGQLIADNQRLGDFVQELARYHRGILRCDPAVAELRISGVFQLQNIDQILAMLADTLPLRISRVTDYWISLSPL